MYCAPGLIFLPAPVEAGWTWCNLLLHALWSRLLQNRDRGNRESKVDCPGRAEATSGPPPQPGARCAGSRGATAPPSARTPAGTSLTAPPSGAAPLSPAGPAPHTKCPPPAQGVGWGGAGGARRRCDNLGSWRVDAAQAPPCCSHKGGLVGLLQRKPALCASAALLASPPLHAMPVQ